MTVTLIGSPRKTSEEARLDKNRRIRESIKATKARRKNQTCSTFDLKIVGNKLSRTQRETLVLGGEMAVERMHRQWRPVLL